MIHLDYIFAAGTTFAGGSGEVVLIQTATLNFTFTKPPVILHFNEKLVCGS